ncbi:MAG: hypothetical protein GXY34_00285 [Syntrophomonadaceae bacterium]|nr:hypothetical protein [Syntrophomonadaceae bacterium]
MTIDNSHGKYDLICDNCGYIYDEPVIGFHDALDVKKEAGWKSKKRNGNWEDWCPECAGESEG